MHLDFMLIVWLLPVVFMIHDFEEIIFFKKWIDKNRAYLQAKYPKLAEMVLSRFGNLSPQAFTVAVAEEFILLCVITVVSVVTGWYLLWLGVFIGFFIHLIIHLIQWMIIRRYVPAIFTTFFSLFYCVFTILYLCKNDIFVFKDIVLWGVIGFLIVIVNLMLAHKLAYWFDEKQGNE